MTTAKIQRLLRHLSWPERELYELTMMNLKALQATNKSDGVVTDQQKMYVVERLIKGVEINTEEVLALNEKKIRIPGMGSPEFSL